MPVVGLVTPPSDRHASSGHPRVVLASVKGTVSIDVTQETDYDNLAAEWVEVQRPTRRPVLTPVGERLATMTIRGIIGLHPAGDGLGPPERVAARLQTLRNMARWAEEHPVACNVGSSVADAWVITDLRFRSTRREHGTNRITRAEVEVSLQEAAFFERPGAAPGSSPSSAVTSPKAAPPPASSTAPATAAAESRTGRRHTVTAGQTLYSVAELYYANGNYWPFLAEANGIRDPRAAVPGTVLVVP